MLRSTSDASCFVVSSVQFLWNNQAKVTRLGRFPAICCWKTRRQARRQCGKRRKNKTEIQFRVDGQLQVLGSAAEYSYFPCPWQTTSYGEAVTARHSDIVNTIPAWTTVRIPSNSLWHSLGVAFTVNLIAIWWKLGRLDHHCRLSFYNIIMFLSV